MPGNVDANPTRSATRLQFSAAGDYAPAMSDPFDLVSAGDLEALRTALAHDPELVLRRNASGASLVAWAAYMGNVGAIAAIRALLPALDPYEAIILRDDASLEAALAAGWDCDHRAPDGFGALALAAFFDNETAFARLLPLTPDVNLKAENPQQVAALHAATAKRNAAMVERLLRAGADPNLTQADGFTPLHAAAHHGDALIAGLLILFGADRSAKNAKGLDAAALAREAGHGWLSERLSV